MKCHRRFATASAFEGTSYAYSYALNVVLKYNIHLFSDFFVLPKKPSRIWGRKHLHNSD